MNTVKNLNIVYKNMKYEYENILKNINLILVKNKGNYNLEDPIYNNIYLNIISFDEDSLIQLSAEIANCMPEFLPSIFKILFSQYS